jgi:transketolase
MTPMFNLQNLSPLQKQLRRRLLEVIYQKKLSHLGSCLSAIDMMIAVYSIKRLDDRFVLSNGHAGLGLYVVLEKEGLMDLEKLDELNIHPDRSLERGIHVSTGSLGQGLPIALGMAIADPSRDIYCMISDGESAEGSIWEALRISVDQKVKNLKVIVNVNGWAAYMAVLPQRLKAQIEGFGLRAIEVNGHSVPELQKAFAACKGGESIIFARTDVQQFPFLHGLDAHYYVMNDQDINMALEALR